MNNLWAEVDKFSTPRLDSSTREFIFEAMNATASFEPWTTVLQRPCPPDAAARFRSQFQWALQNCAARGFSAGEFFEVVWNETLESCPLPEGDQAALREELGHWVQEHLGLS